MIIKVVNKGKHTTYTCAHIGVTHFPTQDHQGVSHIQIEICGGPEENVVVELPRDGQSVFVMNDQGDTVDSYKWPMAADDQHVPGRQFDGQVQAASR